MKNLNKLLSVQLILLLMIKSIVVVEQLNAQPGTVKTHQKISDLEGNFTGVLDDNDRFGIDIENIGDLNGDGITDIAAGAPLDDDGGNARGAVWILFLNSDGTVKGHQKISSLEGNFTGQLDNADRFGVAIASLGDLDGDGIIDIVVSARLDDDGGQDRGAIWILFLNIDGTVKSHQKISDTEGNFTGKLDDFDRFAWSLTNIGDLDKDGITDIAAGVAFDDDGGPDKGALWVLFLNSDGTVKKHQKISSTEGDFLGQLDDTDFFGRGVSSIGDLNNDGTLDIAVMAPGDDDGGNHMGAIWILFLNDDGTVKSHQKISATQGNFCGIVDENSKFVRSSVDTIGDLDGDGIIEFVVGQTQSDDGGKNRGAVWILFLNIDGTVKSFLKISDTKGDFLGALDNNDKFGMRVSTLGDLNGDNNQDFAVSTFTDDDGGVDRGAVWIIFLNSELNPISCGCVTFDHLIHTISFANINIEGVRKSLKSKGNNAKKQFDKGNLLAAGNVLCALLNEVKAQNGKHIDPASALDIENCIITLAANSGISLPCLSGNLRLSNPSGMRFESYPNPTNDKIIIKFSVDETIPITLKFYNILGIHIKTLFKGIAEKNNTYSLEYNMNDLPIGSYYYILTTPAKNYNNRIIISR
ncbi:MAG: hypothetical protein FVQ77_11400 [Cytophagales bacterium]|nr:hypothetical protein [Cytophagales bacterium]